MKSIHSPGTLLGGRYRLIELAGQGGMAEVWRAELLGAEGFRRPVAIKRILKHLTNSPDHRAMFVQEAQLTALLDHPNVVQIYDFGEDQTGLYIAMEWVEGLTMRDLAALFSMHNVRPSPALAAAVGIEVLRALSAAHENVILEADGSTRISPMIHRDVSPSNVLLSIRGVVKLADFGLARAVHRAAVGALTPAGVVKGKLAYMAPEIIKGKPASPLSDLYSCGVLLWETVCGRRLYAGRSEPDIVMALVRGTRAPSVLEYRADVPEALAAVIDKSLSIDPNERYATAVLFARALSDVLRTIPERTDISRLAREVTGAMVQWRKLQAAEAAADALENAGAPRAVDKGGDSIVVEFSKSMMAADLVQSLSSADISIVTDSERSGNIAMPLITRSDNDNDKPRK